MSRERREQVRRERDATARVRLEALRVPVPLVFTLIAVSATAVLTYGATTTRVAVLEANQHNTEQRMQEMVDAQRQTNLKLDELTRVLINLKAVGQ